MTLCSGQLSYTRNKILGRISMRFSKLKIEGWRQFASVEINFHERVTIITGANGAGKSTIMRILAQHFGWNFQVLATPSKGSDGVMQYLSGLWTKFLRGPDRPHNVIGEVEYSNGTSTQVLIPHGGGASYNIHLPQMQSIQGLQINSHRQVSSYQPVGNIPTNALSIEQAYQSYYNEVVQRYNNAYTPHSPTYRMKEAIISMAMFGIGNAHVAPNPELARAYERFKDVLARVLPEPIGYLDIAIRIPDVVIVTKSGEFLLDAASGGLMSLIELAWQIFLYSYNKEEFVVLIDEPENHLHPSMQRRIVGDLSRAFPSAQFVIVTHSPFVVSSVRDSSVYVLRHGDSSGIEMPLSRTVSSIRLDRANKAGTASEILRDVLGVPVTLPEWAESDLRTVADRYNINELGADGINRLKAELSELGLGEYYPDALQQIVNRA